MEQKNLIIICITAIICVAILSASLFLTNNTPETNNTTNDTNETNITLNDTNNTQNNTQTTTTKKSTSKSKSDSSSKSSYQKTSYASEDDVFVINPKTGKKEYGPAHPNYATENDYLYEQHKNHDSTY